MPTFKTSLLGASLLLSMLPASSVHAKTNEILASIADQMQRFTEVATLTKENEHYQPYIISVFYGHELEKIGVSNLKEALTLAPGIDMSTDNANNQTPIFRGSNPQAFGQSKLFIDGTLVNNVFFDAYSEYLYLPVEMIKRIEIVRGPGSKTDGFNAYAGSINVVTYAERIEGFNRKDKAYLKAGSFDYKTAGAVASYEHNGLSLFTDLYYQQDDKRLYAGPDGLSQGVLSLPPLIDNSALSQEGDAPVWVDEFALGMALQYGPFSLKGRVQEHTKGSAYGINLALPRHKDRVKLPSRYLELGYDENFDTLSLQVKLGVKHDEFDSKAQLTPEGWTFIDFYHYATDPATYDWTPTYFPDGGVGEHKARQQTFYHSAFVKYRGIVGHRFTIGYRLFKEETTQVISKITDWGTGIGITDYTDTFPFFDEKARRETHTFFFQDEVQLSPSVTLMYGANYETTTFKDAGLDPRLSAVYQLDPANIFKLIYSRSHRNASWQEMYTMNNNSRIGSTDLDPERVDAFETAYVHKFSTGNYLQTNLFYLVNHDQIHNSALAPEYRNVKDSDIYGAELEYKGNLTSSDRLYLNYSYVKGDEDAGGGSETSLANVATHMAKGYYTYDLSDALSASSIVRYVGEKKRAPEDARDDVKGYLTVDATLRWQLPKARATVTLSAKNLFDADVRYPSVPNSYSEDYTQEGRTFLIGVVKEF